MELGDPTVETAMLEWAAHAEKRLQELADAQSLALAKVHDALFVLCIVLFLHCLGSCVSGTNARERYKH